MVRYRDQRYTYLECPSCNSLTCSPMPNAAMLAAMYGTDFNRHHIPLENIVHPKDPEEVCATLKQLPVGKFLDYGCGAGELLPAAAALGWSAIGVEFDREVAEMVSQRTGCPVHVVAEAGRIGTVDVLHLGDVIEHLTDVNRELPRILQLLKPGGVLIAEGPLEAGPTLFNVVLRFYRSISRNLLEREMAPYHVLMATVRGQREMFRRFGLREERYRVTEVAWPAQARLSLKDIRRPRTVGMYLVRKISQAISWLAPKRWGNRYFFVGFKGTA